MTANGRLGSGPEGRPIYLDGQATTRTDPRVVEAMLPFLADEFGNPHSTEHDYGWAAEEAVEAGREQTARLIGAVSRDVVFTSGATEANNLALRGLAPWLRCAGRPHAVTVATEHASVLETVRDLEGRGLRTTVLRVGPDGLLAPEALAESLRPDTGLVSVMAANHETGVLQDVTALAAVCRERGVLFHCDAAQALGKVPLEAVTAAVDAMSLSAHKIYGPKGIGALYLRREVTPLVTPLLTGGGQQRGLRPGTLPTALCVGFGRACALAGAEMAAERVRLATLADRLLARVRDGVGARLNGHPDRRVPGTLNLYFPGCDGAELVAALRDRVALSTGSACRSAVREPSAVLTAMGLPREVVAGSVRLALGRFTTAEEADRAAEAIIEAVTRVRGDRRVADVG